MLGTTRTLGCPGPRLTAEASLGRGAPRGRGTRPWKVEWLGAVREKALGNRPSWGRRGQWAGAWPAGPSPPLPPQSADGIPPGYEPISLLEALNGLRAVPPAVPPAAPTAPLYEEITYSGVSDGLSQASCPLAGIDRMVESSLQKGKPRSKSPDR